MKKKIGIIGSSYSTGRHHNYETGTNDLAKPFEDWFASALPEAEIINSACAGKGTELYLNKIVYLKDKYDIDVILMELINHRSMMNIKSQEERYAEILHKQLPDIENDVYRSSASIWDYMRSSKECRNQLDFSKSMKHFNTWDEVQWGIASLKYATEFWAMLDIYQAIKLCKMLGIKVVTWHTYFEFPWEFKDTFDSMLQDAHFIKFGEYWNAFDYYYYNVFGEDRSKMLCDVTHFNDTAYEMLVNEFLAPELRKFL